MQHYLLLILSLFFFFHCGQPRNAQSSGDVAQVAQQEEEQKDLPLDQIQLPKGFQLEIFAKDVEDARSLARGSQGTIFVGNRRSDKVYALVDQDGDHKADQKYVIASGLKMPNGVAFKDGDLYVAELNRILRFPNIESQLENPPQYEVVYDKLPSIRHHGWKYLAFGPDGKLYVPVGAPCNICESKDEIFASISRLNPDGSDFEVYAHGVRNSVGFDWHPDSKELWFTDNGRDWMGDDQPPCELNRAAKMGQHFGYPYCHGGTIPDPDFGDLRDCDEFVKPAQNLGAHVAPLGMLFYQGELFPKAYNKQIIFAEHGSWNRSKKSGYKLSLARLEGNEVVSYEDFATGWLDEETQDFWGRPVDVLELPDGSLLVSDDFADVVYRISYRG